MDALKAEGRDAAALEKKLMQLQEQYAHEG